MIWEDRSSVAKMIKDSLKYKKSEIKSKPDRLQGIWFLRVYNGNDLKQRYFQFREDYGL